jgi:hypothetical protein
MDMIYIYIIYIVIIIIYIYTYNIIYIRLCPILPSCMWPIWSGLSTRNRSLSSPAAAWNDRVMGVAQNHGFFNPKMVLDDEKWAPRIFRKPPKYQLKLLKTCILPMNLWIKANRHGFGQTWNYKGADLTNQRSISSGVDNQSTENGALSTNHGNQVPWTNKINKAQLSVAIKSY